MQKPFAQGKKIMWKKNPKMSSFMQKRFTQGKKIIWKKPICTGKKII
jgi:hypothetical protein